MTNPGSHEYGDGNFEKSLLASSSTVNSNGRKINTWALLDGGSDISLCSKGLADELGLSGRAKTFNLSTVSHQSHDVKGYEVSFSVTGTGNGADTITLDTVWTVHKLPISNESIPRQTDIECWSHLEGITLPEVNDAQVQLVGRDMPEAFWTFEEKRRR